MRLNTYAGEAEILAEQPDAVVVATGGLPDVEGWLEGAEYCTSTWDVLANPAEAKDDLLVFDGTGRH